LANEARKRLRDNALLEKTGLKVTDATPLEDLVRAEICIRAVGHADNVLEDMSKADLVKMARTALSGAPCLWHPHLCTVESVLVWHPRRRVHADKVIEDASKAQMAKDARKELWLPLEGEPLLSSRKKESFRTLCALPCPCTHVLLTLSA
jgi:hypothetical protein